MTLFHNMPVAPSHEHNMWQFCSTLIKKNGMKIGITRSCLLSYVYSLFNISIESVIAILAALALMTTLNITLYMEARITEKVWYRQPAQCETPETVMADMKELVYRIHKTLDKLNIPHAVCYGTLWGTLRNSNILPWDNNVDFCVNAENMASTNSYQLIEAFSESEMELEYNSREGHYVVKYGSGLGFITIFKELKKSELMYPTGWVHALRWWFHIDTVNFPSLLLQAPFNTAVLSGIKVPVPHEEIDILKYLYPDDWWLIVKPPGC